MRRAGDAGPQRSAPGGTAYRRLGLTPQRGRRQARPRPISAWESPTMADPTRYRGERGRGFGDDRYGQRGRDQGSDGGYIAQRGFGNARSGYGPEERGRGDHDRGGRAERGGGDWGYPREDRGRDGAPGGGGRERDEDRRDYGDAAGYGGGGSWRDFREVTGRDWDDDRFRNP